MAHFPTVAALCPDRSLPEMIMVEEEEKEE